MTNDDILLEEAFAQKPMSRATFGRLFSYVRPYRRAFRLNLVFTALATVSQLLGPRFIQEGMDRYLAPGLGSAAANRGILIVSLLYLANLLVGWGLSIVQVRTAITIGQGAMNDLRQAVFEHLQALSLSYFDRTHQGRIINRADADIESLDRILTWGANQLLSSVLTLVGVLGLMLGYDWRLGLAVTVVIPPLWIATRLFQERGLQAYRGLREQSSRITSALAEIITGVRVAQAFSREEENLERFQGVQDIYRDRFLVAARIFHTYMPFLGLMSGVGTAIILGYGGTLALRQEITVGELAAFILYLGMFFGPIQTMGDLYNAVLSTAASAERIFQLLDTAPDVRDRPQARPLAPVRGHVQFEGVWFRYDRTPESQWVLEDVSFEARPGETVALVGPTGSGKTSIISLLARFYEPQRGCIRIDGTDLAAATIDSLHRQIGLVTQENFLFTGTVMDNLKFGRPSATEADVVTAARTLGTHALIERFANGYATTVAERGGNFSAGERQLLTFTRALVAQPRILILDEATSAVDPHSEALVQAALERLLAGRTCFVIAHRLSTVRHAHQILVIRQGRILERGDHEHLLRAGGHYAALHQQFIRG